MSKPWQFQYTHGMHNTPEHRAWQKIIQRCTNPKAHNFKRYGGKGVKVCDRWRQFENFYADMGPKPTAKHSIDRYPNLNGDYEPGNCRWATATEQNCNKTNNHLVSYRGTEMALMDAIRASGNLVSRETVRRRLALGWPAEKALETPASTQGQRPK